MNQFQINKILLELNNYLLLLLKFHRNKDGEIKDELKNSNLTRGFGTDSLA